MLKMPCYGTVPCAESGNLLCDEYIQSGGSLWPEARNPVQTSQFCRRSLESKLISLAQRSVPGRIEQQIYSQYEFPACLRERCYADL